MKDIFYLRTAKTGSSSISHWCYQHQTHITNNMLPLDKGENAGLKEKLEEKKYFIFTTVRNPFTRAISCWQQSIRSNWIPKDSPFEFFLDQDLSKITDTHNKTHVIPLTEYLDPYFNKIKKFVKVEQLEKDLREIEEMFGTEKRPIKAYNRGTYRTHRQFDFKSFYTKERIERVIDKYLEDFDTFQYSKNVVDI